MVQEEMTPLTLVEKLQAFTDEEYEILVRKVAQALIAAVKEQTRKEAAA